MKDKAFVCFSVFGLFFSLIAVFTIGNALVVWVMVAFSLSMLFAEVVCRSMPTSIRELQEQNCVRRDGSWSNAREARERKSLDAVRRKVWFLLMLVAFPSLLGLWFLNREVIPIGLGIDVLASYQSDVQSWKSDLHDEEDQFEQWHRKSDTLLKTTTQQHRKMLWNGWPVLAVITCAWIVGCFVFMGRFYIHSLNELKKSAQLRSEDYFWRDLSRLDADHESFPEETANCQ